MPSYRHHIAGRNGLSYALPLRGHFLRYASCSLDHLPLSFSFQGTSISSMIQTGRYGMLSLLFFLLHLTQRQVGDSWLVQSRDRRDSSLT